MMTMIERYSFADKSPGNPFAKWLDEWKTLQNEGWSVEVLLDEKRTHAIALACKEGATWKS